MPKTEELPYDLDLLCEVFRSAEKPPSEFRLGLEAEKFGVLASGSPLPYHGEVGVEGLFARLAERGWILERESPAGPVIALKRGEASVTLEPAAQVELSGTPATSVHELWVELREHLHELDEVSRDWGIRFLHIGFQPLAVHADLPWVPKTRYPIMKRYLPTKGSRGLDMMSRTATVQVNFDYESEARAMSNMAMLLRVTPFLQAMTLNAPFIERRVSRLKSERLDVWLNMDPARSGLIEPLWRSQSPTYKDYASWALSAGMFLIRRGTEVHLNTGQTFDDYLRHGFNGHRATMADWKLHLGTLFPEVRLKTTLEVRGVDALQPRLSMAIPAFLTGLIYDELSGSRAYALLEAMTHAEAVELQRRVAEQGLQAHYNGKPVQGVALELLELAAAGLERRWSRGFVSESELQWLEPLRSSVQRGLTPADILLGEFRQQDRPLDEFLLDRASATNMPL